MPWPLRWLDPRVGNEAPLALFTPPEAPPETTEPTTPRTTQRQDQPLRIAIVNSHYYPDEVGGTERSLRFLAEAAVARGHVVTVFTTGDKRHRTQINGVGVERFNVGSQSASDASGGFWGHLFDSYSNAMAHEMADAIVRFRPDVAHTNNLSGISVSLWSRLKNRGIPIAHTLRDYYLMCPSRAQLRGGEPCGRACGTCKLMGMPRMAATKNVRTVIGTSKYILDRHLRAGAFEGALKDVIYSAYRPTKVLQPRRKVPTERPLVIGYMGRLEEAKGIAELIKTFRQVLAGSPREMVLHIAGTGEAGYVAQLKELASDLPVRFLGTVAPPAFFDAIDLTVVPSMWNEPLARVITESFSHGVPIVASIMGGAPELVVNGRTGWLFDAEDADEFATTLKRAIEETAESRYERLSAQCLTDSQRFLPDRVLDSYVSALHSTLYTPI